ncbi:hypothetical protein AB0K51_01440 [Kitasatospora sp. NPDC049285]|uniref:hypothetical protein n=1 Tax=Kitasatospora sp. NPDC049285 TaxID=3157096 RepID=UPI003431DA4B
MTERRIPGHARAGLKHWALVAAGCAAVVGGALGANSATGAVVTAGQPAPKGGAAAVPDAVAPVAEKAELPLDCGPFPVAVSLQTSAVLKGRPVTVAAAHCQADGGTPPDGVFLLENGQNGTPKVAATLLPDSEGYSLTALAIRSDGSIRGQARGYSSPDVPRFAPDLLIELSWTEHDGQWTKAVTKTPAR